VLHSEIRQLLASLLSEMQKNLGDNLVGLYLYGSLVWGDFDDDVSDIDMLAATALTINDEEFDRLQHMHDDFARQHAAWRDRIEVQYFSLYGLKMFKTQSNPMANISPGEPFHMIQANRLWLMNWYFVQDYGLTLFGPPPQTLIDPITKDEFLLAVQDDAASWRERIANAKNSPRHQSYAILTLCRALYAHQHREQTSKKRAALWASQKFPAWADLIEDALIWRKTPPSGSGNSAKTEKFALFMIDQVTGGR
jgi:hypothetical protein